MKTIEMIHHRGQPAALVAGDKAIIPDHLTGVDRAHVEAKALYAIEIYAGDRPGPYTDTDAEAYARRARRAATPRQRRRGSQPRRRPRASH